MAKKRKRKTPKRKIERDENQMAYDVVAHMERLSKDPAAQSLGRRGGIARKRNLSLERLTEIGKQGAAARWGKHKKETVAPTGNNQ
jgi:hypothetical protein